MHDRVASLLLLLGLATGVWGCPSSAPEPGQAACIGRAIAPGALDPGLRLESLPEADRPEFADIVRVREIAGEPRPVLPGVRAGDAFGRIDVDLTHATRAPFVQRIDLSAGRYQGAHAVWVAPRLRVAQWHTLDPVRLEVEDDGARYATLTLDLSAFAGGAEDAKLTAMVYVVPEPNIVRFQTRPLSIPANAGWLAFAMGIPEPARDAGPLRFRLEACRAGQCACLHEEVIEGRGEAGALDAGGAGGVDAAWHERRLAIPELAGTSVALRFTSQPVDSHTGALALGQWTRPRLLATVAPEAKVPPNVVLISLDTLGARHMEAYGYARATSPFASGVLAARGVLFENAVAPATTTAPSHMTLFTSLPPSVHGVVSNLLERALGEGVPTLASLLRDAGYATASINENGAMTRRAGFDRGFDFYVERTGATIMNPEGFVDEIFETGLRFMEGHRAERFFVFLHTYEVHFPFQPPARYAGLFAEGDDPNHPDNVALGAHQAYFHPVLYDREIRRVDDALRGLFASMEAMGLLENTLVIVTSDHGEAFLEHGLVGHGSDVYEEAVHIPLLVAGPGVAAGRRVSEPVGLIDIAPTVLDWLGVPRPPELMGRSLAPFLRDADVSPEAVYAGRALVSEAWHPWGGAPEERGEIEAPVIGVRVGHTKLIRTKWPSGPTYEYYDLAQDPRESQDRFDARDPQIAALVQIADAYEAEQAEIVRARALPPLETGRASAEDVAPDRIEALKALGYIE